MLTKFAQIGGSNLSTFTRTGPTPLKRGSTSTHTNGNQNIKVDAKHIKKHAKHIKKHLGLFFMICNSLGINYAAFMVYIDPWIRVFPAINQV